jgi:hypothetical protein
VRQLAENEGWRVGWVFDGRNLYAPTLFLPQHETEYQACLQLLVTKSYIMAACLQRLHHLLAW